MSDAASAPFAPEGLAADYRRTLAARPPRSVERDGDARARAALDEGVRSSPAGKTAGDLGVTIAAAMGIAPGDVGFGRFGHEPPSLHGDDPTPLDDGFTLCVEHAGLNFVAEEEHVVRDARIERLSPPAPAEILVI